MLIADNIFTKRALINVGRLRVSGTFECSGRHFGKSMFRNERDRTLSCRQEMLLYGETLSVYDTCTRFKSFRQQTGLVFLENLFFWCVSKKPPVMEGFHLPAEKKASRKEQAWYCSRIKLGFRNAARKYHTTTGGRIGMDKLKIDIFYTNETRAIFPYCDYSRFLSTNQSILCHVCDTTRTTSRAALSIMTFFIEPWTLFRTYSVRIVLSIHLKKSRH